MHCNSCNYFKILRTNNESSSPDNFICELTDYVFPEDVEDMNIEYPCSKVGSLPASNGYCKQ